MKRMTVIAIFFIITFTCVGQQLSYHDLNTTITLDSLPKLEINNSSTQYRISTIDPFKNVTIRIVDGGKLFHNLFTLIFYQPILI